MHQFLKMASMYKKQREPGMNMCPPALSSRTRSSWESVSGWRWPRACGRHGRGPGGLKALGASWRRGWLHLSQERRVPAFAPEQTRGWQAEGGCRLEAAWCSDPRWDSMACGAPKKDGGWAVTMLLINWFLLNIKHQEHTWMHCLHIANVQNFIK